MDTKATMQIASDIIRSTSAVRHWCGQEAKEEAKAALDEALADWGKLREIDVPQSVKMPFSHLIQTAKDEYNALVLHDLHMRIEEVD